MATVLQITFFVAAGIYLAAAGVYGLVRRHVWVLSVRGGRSVTGGLCYAYSLLYLVAGITFVTFAIFLHS